MGTLNRNIVLAVSAAMLSLHSPIHIPARPEDGINRGPKRKRRKFKGYQRKKK